MHEEVQGLCCGVKSCVLDTNRKHYAQRNAKALFCGIWTCDVKVMFFPK